jgi:acyl-coenzyme A thioesterase PaaI-like protein
VVHAGKKIMVSESEVFSVPDGQERLVAKAMVTLMAVVLSAGGGKQNSASH